MTNELLLMMEDKILNIDNQQIVYTKKWQQWQIKPPISLFRQSIHQLVYTRKHTNKHFLDPVPGKLEILAEQKRRKKKIQLNANNMISGSEEELEWLAQEISNWLQIPIIKI